MSSVRDASRDEQGAGVATAYFGTGEADGYDLQIAHARIKGGRDVIHSDGNGGKAAAGAAMRGPSEDADTLGALAISVPAIYREKGYARLMIRELLALAERKGLKGLVAPVRPSLKARHPRVAIEDYITWTDDRGRPYDPWLRSHLASGGRLVGPCARSMVVEEPVGFWENWTKQRFEQSGSYDVPGALVPLEIDLEQQRGRYEEPNVWVAYTVGSA